MSSRPLLLVASTMVMVASAFQPVMMTIPTTTTTTTSTQLSMTASLNSPQVSRRQWGGILTAAAGLGMAGLFTPPPAHAVGPVKINLLNPTYSAVPCPKDKPIPGEKAMKGMKGLCVTVNVDLENPPEKPLELVGVYGFVTDQETGESVLANNPDLSTDAGTSHWGVPKIWITCSQASGELLFLTPVGCCFLCHKILKHSTICLLSSLKTMICSQYRSICHGRFGTTHRQETYL